MDANLLSSSFMASPSPSVPAVQGVSPPGAAPGAMLRGADFANLLSSMLADPQRQGLAAAGLAEAGLQAVSLGSQIEVITAAKPVPDAGSLMAFARSQGLDETTLASLFGEMAAPPPAGVSGLSATSATLGAGYFLAGQVLVGQGQSGLSSVSPELSLAPVAPAFVDPSLTPLTVLNASPLALQAPVDVIDAVVSSAAPDGSGIPASMSVPAAYFLSTPPLVSQAMSLPPTTGHAVSAEAKQAALTAVVATDLAWQVTKAPVQAALTGPAAMGEVQPAVADEAMKDALRVELLLPREAITALTRRLASLSGNGQAQAWGNLTANAIVTASAGQAPLDMRQFFTPAGSLGEPLDSLEALDGASSAVSDADTAGLATLPQDGSRKASGSLTLTPDAANLSQAGLRAENYQQLADRLGQALGQRLQAQIERGEWKMQMRMDPASLGRIDLELQMRSGGLDAIFRSDNPLTRELITQGLSKLRESLSQSGTAVANVWVNGDSARQSGGNPTPSQTPRGNSPKESDADGGAGPSVVGPLAVGGVRQGGSSSVLDVLA
jgi:flagellar hook-length control protein FliK